MKKLKTQKGITLIALIITIVVLLILAAVAIGAVQDSNIVGYAQNAAGGYDKAKGDENNTISDMEKILEQYANGGNNASNSGTNNGSNSGSGNGGNTEPPQEPPVDTTLSVGKTIYYDSNNDNQKEEWIVYSMTDENNFEIISANTMGYLTLGYNDPYLPQNGVGDLNNNGTAEDDIDKAVWSYNHAIATINTYCESLITSTDHSGVRSIGATPTQDIVGDNTFLNGLKDSDTYGEEAINYLSSINCLTSKDSNNYWIASRKFAVGGAFNPTVYQVGLSGDVGNYFYEDGDNLAEIMYIPLASNPPISGSARSKTAGVRPIIINPVNYSFTNN